MPRRTKLLITAIFLVLLGIPVTYIALIWHPPNPLRFRVVEESVEKHPRGVSYHWMRMELRNTSDVTVVFLSVTFYPERGHGAGMPHLFSKVGLWEYKPVVIPPGGTTEVDFDTRMKLSVDTIAKIQAGEKPAREGSIEYAWLSPPQVRFEEMETWLSGKLPASWRPYMPTLEPCTDTTDVEAVPRQKPVTSASDTQ